MLARLRAMLDPLGPTWGHLRGYVGPSWGYVGPSWGCVGPACGPSWAIWGYIACAFWGLCCATLTHLDPQDGKNGKATKDRKLRVCTLGGDSVAGAPGAPLKNV